MFFKLTYVCGFLFWLADHICAYIFFYIYIYYIYIYISRPIHKYLLFPRLEAFGWGFQGFCLPILQPVVLAASFVHPDELGPSLERQIPSPT